MRPNKRLFAIPVLTIAVAGCQFGQRQQDKALQAIGQINILATSFDKEIDGYSLDVQPEQPAPQENFKKSVYGDRQDFCNQEAVRGFCAPVSPDGDVFQILGETKTAFDTVVTRTTPDLPPDIIAARKQALCSLYLQIATVPAPAGANCSVQVAHYTYP